MKKFITSLLLAAFITTSLASCGGGGTSTPTDTEASGTSADTAAAETTTAAETSPLDNLPDKKFDGYTFNILSRSAENGWKWESIDIVSDGENGEPINDAVFARNRELEETFEIKIATKKVKYPQTDIQTAVLAGESIADMFTTGVSYLSTMIPSDIMIDFNEAEYINFEGEYWDQRMIMDMSIKNKVYMMTGDISIMDNAGTWILGFNKDMVTEFKLDNPYELVKEGKWTYENMHNMMKTIPADLDGNGSMEDFDRYAIVGEQYNNYVFLVGSGVSITTKNEDDLPELSIYNDTTLQALDWVDKIQGDPNVALLNGRLKGTYTQAFDECLNKNFGEGRALFWMGGMKVLEWYRDYEVDFGLLPTPQLNEAQEEYYCSYSTGNLTAYAIPKTNTDLERTGLIFEAMGALSKSTLTEAYYEVTLKGKALRDEESVHMLDLVLNSRLYDMGANFDWGGIFGILRGANYSTFSSSYASLEKAAETAITQFIESVK